jgi:poly-gamma-glutamate capsule biosynthesis protein CapA/YwtB (metallophosphatase superfamily)
MKLTAILTGDVNLKAVDDPAVPFARIADVLRKSDLVFGNLECCLSDPPDNYSPKQEGFYAKPRSGGALKIGGFHGVGCANNVTYGAAAVLASLRQLEELGIGYTGAGLNRKAARKPLILEKKGIRFGFLQYTSIFWPGQAADEHSPGVSTIKAHTAYQPRIANRAGVPPLVLTFADQDELIEFKEDVISLRKKVDILVSSHHWGMASKVLAYQKEIAHVAVDAGADIVMGHGVHYPLPIEIYKGKPIFYGLGCFSFHTGHEGRIQGDWVGLMVKVTLEDKTIVKVTATPVRHNSNNETIIRSPTSEPEAIKKLSESSNEFDTKLKIESDEIGVWPSDDEER